MKDDGNDVHNPSQVEGHKGRGKRKKNKTRSEYEPHVAHGREGQSGNESPKGTSKLNANDFEREPPPKRIKLSQSSNNESTQKELVELNDEEQNEMETEIEIDYKNINANFFAEELSPDDEILTFQCPKNLNVKHLLNKSLDLSMCTKLKDDLNKYICQTSYNKEKKVIDCIFPSKEKGAVILKMPVVGHIVCRQILKASKNNVDRVDCDSEIVRLPDFQSMNRHPLLGTNWENHLNRVGMHLKEHRKILKQSLKHKKSLEMYEKERKEKKKKLKVELALIKKKQILDTNNFYDSGDNV